MTSKSSKGAGTSREAPPALSLIDKRSVVYARLPVEAKGNVLTAPKRVRSIPYSDMVWIEHLLKEGGTDWPWFGAVIQFIQSLEYQKVQKSILAEIQREREHWDKIARGESISKRKSIQDLESELKQAVADAYAQTASREPKREWDPNKPVEGPYFWENVDPSWWREQS